MTCHVVMSFFVFFRSLNVRPSILLKYYNLHIIIISTFPPKASEGRLQPTWSANDRWLHRERALECSGLNGVIAPAPRLENSSLPLVSRAQRFGLDTALIQSRECLPVVRVYVCIRSCVETFESVASTVFWLELEENYRLDCMTHFDDRFPQNSEAYFSLSPLSASLSTFVRVVVQSVYSRGKSKTSEGYFWPFVWSGGKVSVGKDYEERATQLRHR